MRMTIAASGHSCWTWPTQIVRTEGTVPRPKEVSGRSTALSPGEKWSFPGFIAFLQEVTTNPPKQSFLSPQILAQGANKDGQDTQTTQKHQHCVADMHRSASLGLFACVPLGFVPHRDTPQNHFTSSESQGLPFHSSWHRSLAASLGLRSLLHMPVYLRLREGRQSRTGGGRAIRGHLSSCINIEA